MPRASGIGYSANSTSGERGKAHGRECFGLLARSHANLERDASLVPMGILWYKLAVQCDCDNDVEVSDTVKSSGTSRFDYSLPPEAR